jgi:hypothetical protein
MPLASAPPASPAIPTVMTWSIHEDGQEIGRLYEDTTATRPELTWFRSIIVMGPARHIVRTDARAVTLEEAKAQFAAALKPFQRVAKDRVECEALLP